MSGIYHKNKVWANVTIPNPQDAATADLEKVKIDGTTYDVKDADAIHSADVGVANGVAELDANGFVPQAQLPSYVDDVLEYASVSAFPATGESGKIYVALDTNKTYRWSGSGYVEISESLALGDTSSTAYRGDRGKTAYDHSQTTSGNPHNVSKTDVGLGNVPNVTTDNQTPTVTEASTRANLAVGDSLKTIIGKIKKFFADLKTVAFTGSYTDLTDQPTIPVIPSNNITGSGTNGKLTKWNGANSITDGPALSSAVSSQTQSTKFLREDGTWSAPSYTTNTDEKVKQENTTGSADYRVLLSNGANDTTETKTARKSTKLKFNPSTGNLQATQLNGVNIGSSPKFTDENTTYTLSVSGNNIVLTPSSGSANTITVPYATNAGSLWWGGTVSGAYIEGYAGGTPSIAGYASNNYIPTCGAVLDYLTANYGSKLFYKYVSGTTNANGFLNMGVTVNNGVLIGVNVLQSDLGYLAVPYRQSSSSTSAQMAFVFTSTFNAVKSKSVEVVGVFVKDPPNIT